MYDAENRNQLFSILTWPDQDGIAPEAFARLEHRSGWFVKGTFGGLDIRSSRMHDEDTAEAMAPGSYSNTVSVTKNGRTLYGTLDLGLLLEKTSGGDLGAFVGYGYYSQHLNAYGCRQVASNTVACHASTIPSSTLVGSEHEEWDAVRLGLAGRLSLTERLKFSGEVAWLPYARFKATDNHWLRPSINPIRQRGSGSRGFQLETSLIFAVSRHWDIGAGVRYLSLEADGYTQFPAAPTRSRMEFTSQRTTAFLQTAYHFDL